MSVFKFTPDFMSKEQIDHITVGRNGLLSHSAEKIYNAVQDGRTINMIFVGPRGIGKSHTALRLVSELENKGAVTPVRLSEEEYSISSLNEFFSKVLYVLNESTDQESIEHAREVFKTYRKQGRPVIILVENLQMIFPEMDQDLPYLRSIILEDQSFFIVGTALSTFDQITSPSSAFYNFFEINKLKGLGIDDIAKLIKLRIGNNQSDQTKESSLVNLHGLRILTGGNPRLVHMLCDIMLQTKSYDGLEKNLMDLLDSLTPFYQARMEVMPPEKRKVFDTLALSEGPATPTEIASKLKSKNTLVTAHLARLRNDGIIARIKLRKKRETRYQVSDRLYRVWREFRTRDGRTKTTAFVRFLKLWYSQYGLIKEYNRESDALESILGDIGKARSRLHTIRCLFTAMSYDWGFLNDAVRKFVDKGDYRGAESIICDFRNKHKDEKDPLLSTCAEIIAKNAERSIISHNKCKDHLDCIFADMEKVDRIIQTHKNLRNDNIVHAVSQIVVYAIDLNNLDLAHTINNHARAHLVECEICMCFTHNQISIMDARNDHLGALKTINDALSTKNDPGLISRRAILYTRMHNKTQAMRDVQILLPLDKFLSTVFFAYSRFSMFVNLSKILCEKFSVIKAMNKTERNRMIENLLVDIIAALNGRFLDSKNHTALTECVRTIKPFITSKVISSNPLGFLIEHGHGVDNIGRTLDTLFHILDKDQLGMLTILKCAVDYARDGNTDPLERLHPEQRELALDMISTISPDTRIPQEVLDSVK